MRKSVLISALLLFGGAMSFAQQAKYVFFFIGDGMGTNHVNGTEMYLAEKQGRIGVEPLLFSTFPYTGLSKTYSSSNPVTDSAAGGTALAVGEKTSNGTIGMNSDHSKSLESVAEKAKKSGRNVGVATSVSIDHATPASFYAHQPSRKMAYEIGTDLTKSDFDFFAGSGFVSPDNKKDKKAPNLFDLFRKSGYKVVRGADEFSKTKKKDDKVILIQKEGKNVYSLPFAVDRKDDDLTLTQITESAISHLTKNNKGFFVMIEGGMIDWSSHSNDGGTTFEEVIDMDNAIKKAYDFYLQKPDSTLIVVTADHETGGLSLGRGKYVMDFKLFGNQTISQSELSAQLRTVAQNNPAIAWSEMKDFLASKLGFFNAVTITDAQEKRLENEFNRSFKSNDEQKAESEYFKDEKLAALAVSILNENAKAGWTTDSHTAAYVPVFAVGVGAEKFTGVMENIDIPAKITDVAGY